jgi:hypothetical protein
MRTVHRFDTTTMSFESASYSSGMSLSSPVRFTSRLGWNVFGWSPAISASTFFVNFSANSTPVLLPGVLITMMSIVPSALVR